MALGGGLQVGYKGGEDEVVIKPRAEARQSSGLVWDGRPGQATVTFADESFMSVSRMLQRMCRIKCRGRLGISDTTRKRTDTARCSLLSYICLQL